MQSLATHSPEIEAPSTRVETAARRDPRGRLEFLDALRGIAALCVVFEHVLELQVPAVARFSMETFRIGEFGVVVFFLCSGYIIPASLENRGSVRAFWIGRFFRLFPLYWVCLMAVLVLHFGFNNYRGLSDTYWSHWHWNTLVNLTMLQDMTNVPLMLGQSWTLAYEMLFYISVSVLFVVGLHRRSAPLAAIGMVLAMSIANGLRPHALSMNHSGPAAIAALICAAGVAVLILFLARSAGWLTATAASLAGAFVILALFNRQEPAYEAAFFLGTMFVGTALYRWSQGQLSNRRMALLGLLVGLTVLVSQARDWSPWLDSVPTVNARFHQAEMTTFLAAYGVFFAALLFRDVRFPRVLTYLGTISYSMYLVHALVIYSGPVLAGWKAIVYGIGLTILISALTYRFVEKPAIAIGRRLVARPSR